jgi:hypothetical protein
LFQRRRCLLSEDPGGSAEGGQRFSEAASSAATHGLDPPAKWTVTVWSMTSGSARKMARKWCPHRDRDPFAVCFLSGVVIAAQDKQRLVWHVLQDLAQVLCLPTFPPVGELQPAEHGGDGLGMPAPCRRGASPTGALVPACL